MSPRPRKASDQQVLSAASRVMSRFGPAQWTLADIADEAGLTAGALVQRFGSKRGLLLALASQGAASARLTFDQLRATHRSPLAALRGYADCIARLGTSPAGLAHHLAYLQLDLTDPDMRREVGAQARACRAEIRRLLEAAIAAGELPAGTDTRKLARAVEVTLSGSLMTWAFYQQGSAIAWLRTDLTVLLQRWSAQEPR